MFFDYIYLVVGIVEAICAVIGAVFTILDYFRDNDKEK